MIMAYCETCTEKRLRKAVAVIGRLLDTQAPPNYNPTHYREALKAREDARAFLKAYEKHTKAQKRQRGG